MLIYIACVLKKINITQNVFLYIKRHISLKHNQLVYMVN